MIFVEFFILSPKVIHVGSNFAAKHYDIVEKFNSLKEVCDYCNALSTEKSEIHAKDLTMQSYVGHLQPICVPKNYFQKYFS